MGEDEKEEGGFLTCGSRARTPGISRRAEELAGDSGMIVKEERWEKEQEAPSSLDFWHFLSFGFAA